MTVTDSQEPTTYLVGHLEEALACDPRVNELDVHVTVAGGKIFLTGNVATPERREAVTEVAREVAPGYEIDNQTTVYRLAEVDEAEHLS